MVRSLLYGKNRFFKTCGGPGWVFLLAAFSESFFKLAQVQVNPETTEIHTKCKTTKKVP